MLLVNIYCLALVTGLRDHMFIGELIAVVVAITVFSLICVTLREVHTSKAMSECAGAKYARMSLQEMSTILSFS